MTLFRSFTGKVQSLQTSRRHIFIYKQEACWKTDSIERDYLGDWRDPERNQNMLEDKNDKQVGTITEGSLKNKDMLRHKKKVMHLRWRSIYR